MKIVEYHWVDSLIVDNEWSDADNIGDEDLTDQAMMHRSVGFLVNESADAVAIATSINWQEGDHQATRVQGRLIIPRCAIRETKVLFVDN